MEYPSIVVVGAVVSKEVSPNCIVVGNPAMIIKTGVKVEKVRTIEEGKRIKSDD